MAANKARDFISGNSSQTMEVDWTHALGKSFLRTTR